MRQEKIIINENGSVSVPDNIQMRDFEIAELFGVFAQTIKANIRAILKSGVCECDLSNGGTVVGNSIIPDYHGLDMITALAFRIQSPNAELFRQWIFRKMTTVQKPPTPLYVRLPHGAIPN